MAEIQRANPSTDAYERARKVVHGWLSSLSPESAAICHEAGYPGCVAVSEDDGGQLIDSVSWEIDNAKIAGWVQGRDETLVICDERREAEVRFVHEQYAKARNAETRRVMGDTVAEA